MTAQAGTLDEIKLKIGEPGAGAAFLISCKTPQRPPASSSLLLLNPAAPEMGRRAPEIFDVRLETSKGLIVIEVHRDWAPHGADRFYNLARAGYYDGARFFRVIEGRWAQFGINGDPEISNVWRGRCLASKPLTLLKSSLDRGRSHHGTEADVPATTLARSF